MEAGKEGERAEEHIKEQKEERKGFSRSNVRNKERSTTRPRKWGTAGKELRGKLAIQTDTYKRKIEKKNKYLLTQDRMEERKNNRRNIFGLPGYENNQGRRCEMQRKPREDRGVPDSTQGI